MKATAIILAAGASQRMGTPKALLEAARGLTFLARLARTFERAGLAPLVVVGAHAAQIRAAHPGVPSVLNAGWADGQLSSVRVGLRAALAQGAQRILIHPVDAPLLRPATAARVLAALASAPAAVAHFKGKPGHPLALRASAARAVLGLAVTTLEQAAATLEPQAISVDDEGTLDNLNSPEAYARRFGR